MTSTRKAFAWSFAERHLGVIIGLAASMLIARILTPAQVGLFSICAALLAVAATIREFGVSEYIIQERSLDDDKLRRAYGVAILTAWSMGAAVYATRHLIAGHYEQPELANIIQVLCLSYFLLPLATPAYAILARQMQFKALLFVHTASGLVGACTSVALALRGHGPISLAWGAVALTATQVIGVTIARPRSSMLLPSFRGIGPILRFGSTLVSARVLESGTNNAHEFILAHYFGFTSVGLFSRAKGLVDTFHSSITSAVARVATPDMAQAMRSDKSLIDYFAKGTAVFTATSWSFYGFVALGAPEIIVLMFGSQWSGSAVIASCLALAMLPTPLFALCGSVIAAAGQVRRRLRIALRWCPVHLVLLLAGAQFGVLWVAAAWFVTNLVIAAASAHEVRGTLQCSLRSMYGATARSVPVALASVLTQAAVLYLMRDAGLHPVPALLVTAAAGAASFTIAARGLRHPVYAEAAAALARVLRRPGRSPS
jgi:O-antigen/teichoic acid export membrane protein